MPKQYLTTPHSYILPPYRPFQPPPTHAFRIFLPPTLENPTSKNEFNFNPGPAGMIPPFFVPLFLVVPALNGCSLRPESLGITRDRPSVFFSGPGPSSIKFREGETGSPTISRWTGYL
jgi:hypothetical protein